VGLYGVVVVVLLLVGAQRLGAITELLSGSDEVTAYFTDSSGLSPGDRVEISGIAVGRVREVEIDGTRIRVVAGVDSPVSLGEETRAAIKVGNLLGSKYLELEPAGRGALEEPIPIDRTVPAYDVVSAVSDLSETVDEIDTRQLARALDTVASTFRGAAPDVRRAVQGVSDLSRTIAARDRELQSLLAGAEQVTGSLDGSKEQLSRFVRAAGLLLEEVDRRQAAIDGLVEHSAALSEQLRGLVRDNRRRIGPALANINRVVGMLQERQVELQRTVHNLATFARVFVDTIGSGPWFDSYIANVPDEASTSGPER
jgi:phospholipid/cholesterol/gamma-HCH transport system substrate-binding protein